MEWAVEADLMPILGQPHRALLLIGLHLVEFGYIYWVAAWQSSVALHGHGAGIGLISLEALHAIPVYAALAAWSHRYSWALHDAPFECLLG
jgi:hypothetical protein